MTLTMHITPFQIFAVLGVCLVIAEIFIPGFVVLPIGLGFLITAPVALATSNWAILLTVLAVAELAVFLLFKKVLRPLHGKTKTYSNAEGMIGRECEVVEAISKTGSGYVKLYGDRWEAKSELGREYPAGARVIIVKIDGNKVIVNGLLGEEN